MRLKEAIDEFSKLRRYEITTYTNKGHDTTLRYFAMYMENCDVEEVRPSDVSDYFETLEKLGWDRRAFVTKVNGFRKFFRFLRLQNYKVFHEDLIPVPRKVFVMPRTITLEEHCKILSVIPQNQDPRHLKNRAILMLLWDTGCRIGEILDLDIDDLKNRQAIIKTKKSRGFKPIRQIFWTKDTQREIDRWLQRRKKLKYGQDEKALFIGASGGFCGRRFTPTGMAHSLRAYSKKAGIFPFIHCHMYRHAYGRALARKGVNNGVISDLMGHSNINSSRIYTTLEGTDLKKEWAKVRG